MVSSEIAPEIIGEARPKEGIQNRKKLTMVAAIVRDEEGLLGLGMSVLLF